jgi:hypothetical protein
MVRSAYNVALVFMEAPMVWRTRNSSGLANARAYANPGGGKSPLPVPGGPLFWNGLP